MDEPTEGIQPNIIQEIGRVISHLRDEGQMAILLVEQYFDFAFDLADRFYADPRLCHFCFQENALSNRVTTGPALSPARPYRLDRAGKAFWCLDPLRENIQIEHLSGFEPPSFCICKDHLFTAC